MSHRTTYYVGPKAPIWPLGRGVRGLGCGFLVWLLLLLGLGLVAFSLSMVAGLTPFLERHANMIWATVSVLSLAWPASCLLPGRRSTVGPAGSAPSLAIGRLPKKVVDLGPPVPRADRPSDAAVPSKGPLSVTRAPGNALSTRVA